MAQTTLARLVRKSADKKENNQIMNSVSQIAIAGFWRKKRESRTQNDVVIILCDALQGRSNKLLGQTDQGRNPRRS